MYSVEQGPVQQSVSNSARRLKGKVPDKFNNAPELRWGLELYYEAFLELDSERSHGSGWTYIPWTSVIRYAEVYEFDEDQTERLLTHIKAMDNAHIKKLADDREAREASK